MVRAQRTREEIRSTAEAKRQAVVRPLFAHAPPRPRRSRRAHAPRQAAEKDAGRERREAEKEARDEQKRERAVAFDHLERDRQADRARRVQFLLNQTDIFQYVPDQPHARSLWLCCRVFLWAAGRRVEDS
jgi:hypothetical protein